MDADEAKRQGLDANNIAPGFRISGLGQLVEGGIESDRLVIWRLRRVAMATKNFLFVNRKAPYGTVYALESLEADFRCIRAKRQPGLIDDGVYQIIKGQNSKGIGMKTSRRPTVRCDYDITKLYVSTESLAERGLTVDDLMELTYEDADDDYAEKPSIILVNREEMAAMMAEQEVIRVLSGGIDKWLCYILSTSPRLNVWLLIAAWLMPVQVMRS